MKTHWQDDVLWLETDWQRIRYRRYCNPYHPAPRRLLLVHGAGVAGDDTWGHLVPYLSHWSEVLVPDLRGMGETCYPDGVERPCRVEEYVDDLVALLDHHGWWAFDLAGYSLGGLLALLLKARYPHRVHKQFLVESALLDRADMAAVIALRDRYSEAAQRMREPGGARDGVQFFLDTISPNRILSPRAEATTIDRLARRSLGFSYALDAVSEACRRLDRAQLLAVQKDVSSFVGGRSVEELHRYQAALAASRPDWRYHCIRGCDHSLPFQKPRQVARQMNADMADYLAR
ncbi:alpha/beta fold hydrolase [Motiliproteus sp. SC1-56]|uniref:alpha/beta fold hydrolase n=1 Tax=Motiliproteus sp. SC1-56 TaxID=2799565 RepID=UPI001A8E40F3|nr:alpha/beta hydrolase [Motiliproteus sp. SC1-56]